MDERTSLNTLIGQCIGRVTVDTDGTLSVYNTKGERILVSNWDNITDDKGRWFKK